MANKFSIFDRVIPSGKRKIIEVSLPSLYSAVPMNMPIYVINGKNPGPVLLVTAAIHGDEINGVEIVRRLYKSSKIHNLSGTLLAIPVVNLYGLTNLSRYLPDRRDLNRCFPSRNSGALASKIANIFNEFILPRVNCVIDLHTGSLHRSNLPQVRASLSSKKLVSLAKSFNAPIILKSENRKGSFREAAENLDIPFLLYEAGEALRLDELSIRYGVRGILNVMSKMKMISSCPEQSSKKTVTKIAQSSSWLRSPTSGVIEVKRKLGQKINKDDIIGYIFDPFTTDRKPIVSSANGIIIGKNNLPLINAGDPIINVAHLKTSKNIETDMSELNEYANF